MGLIADLKAEMTALKGARWSAAAVLAIGLCSGFGAASYLRSQEVTNAQTAEHAAEVQRDQYKDAASGADPSELQKQLDDLKAQVSTLQDKVLTPGQTAILQKVLSEGKGDISITYVPFSGQSYAKDLNAVFEKSGWKTAVNQSIFASPGDDTAVVIGAEKPETTETLVDAFKAAGLPYVFHPDQGANKVQELWLEVPKHTGP